MSSDWAEYGLRPALKAAGIYDPDTITLREIVVPKPPADLPSSRSTRSRADRRRGTRQEHPTRCQMCHAIGGTGAELGPALDGWGRGKSADVIATAIVRPAPRSRTATTAWSSRRRTGVTIQGVLIKEGDPLMMRSMGGVTQIIPADRVASRRRMPGSLMMSAAQRPQRSSD
jgi:putative heme-binding domain-containing protein